MTPSETIAPPKRVASADLCGDASGCFLLIVTGGFEERARRVVEFVREKQPRHVLLLQYKPGIAENDENFKRLKELLLSVPSRRQLATAVLDLARPDEFAEKLRATLLPQLPEADGQIWVDVSALPMQIICVALAIVRQVFPGRAVRILYTEASQYYPTKREVAKGSRQSNAMSQEMSGILIPKMFSGSSGDNKSCLLVFAGYEKHRSMGVVDELNPSKLVLIFGIPPRDELRWRLKWSQGLHDAIRGTRPTAIETVSTLDPRESVHLLNSYYSFLFAEYNVAISPICSKMQCVASYLLWERYRDIQLVFPLPVTYLPKRFSKGCGDTYQFMLPNASQLMYMAPAMNIGRL